MRKVSAQRVGSLRCWGASCFLPPRCRRPSSAFVCLMVSPWPLPRRVQPSWSLLWAGQPLILSKCDSKISCNIKRAMRTLAWSIMILLRLAVFDQGSVMRLSLPCGCRFICVMHFGDFRVCRLHADICLVPVCGARSFADQCDRWRDGLERKHRKRRALS